MSEQYEGRQYVGMDVHRRRSVLVRMTETGERLEAVRIVNGRDRLAAVMAAAGEAPEVVLEATYGWDWAADALAEMGATVHLAHPLGVKAFSYRRVKTSVTLLTWLICCGWAGCPRRGSRRRPLVSCASWCGTARSWCICVPGCAARCTPCLPVRASQCRSATCSGSAAASCSRRRR